MQASQYTERKKGTVFFASRFWLWMKGIWLLAFLLGLSLYTIGIPKAWVASVIEWPIPQGLHVDFAWVKWKIIGWEFSDVVVHEQDTDLRVDIKSLKVSSLRRQHPSVHNPLRIEMNEASMQKETTEISSSRYIDQLVGYLHREDKAWVFSEGRVDTRYITLAFEGRVEEGMRLSAHSIRSGELLSHIELFTNSVKLHEKDHLSGKFCFTLCKEASRSSLDWQIAAATMRIEQLQIDSLSLKGTMNPEGYMVRLDGTVDTSDIRLEGCYDPRSHSLDMSFSHQINGFDLSKCLSDKTRAWLKDKGFEQVICSPFSVQLSSIDSLDDIDIRFVELGTVEINEDSYALSEIYAKKQGAYWLFSIELSAQGERAAASDKVLRCMGSYHSEEGHLEVELISSLHPHRLWRVLPMHAQLREQLLVWNTESASPHIYIHGDLFLAEDKQDISASIKGKQLSYRDVSFAEISMDLLFRDNQLRLSKIEGIRGDESIQLDLLYDFSKGWMEYVGSAHLAYADLFTLMHVNTDVLEYIQVKDTPYSSFSGRYSLRDELSLDYQFYTKTAAATWYTFMVDEGELDLRVGADQVKQVTAQARFLGGELVCNGEVHPSSLQQASTFTGHWSAANIELEQSKRADRKEHEQRRLDASGTLTYDLHEGVISSGEGEAEVTLRGAKLAELPFLAGLHDLLEEVLPLERWFAFDQLKGTLRYKDKKFHSDSLVMSGPLMKASIEGDYDWEKGYDAIMRLQLKNDTDLERLMSVLTKPLLRVFDINLEGTFHKPRWRLRKWDDLIN